MAKLDINTWIRFTVWLIIGKSRTHYTMEVYLWALGLELITDDDVFVAAGVLIYVFYSIPNSVLGQRAKKLEEFPIRDNTKI